jgi:hypothetical protein
MGIANDRLLQAWNASWIPGTPNSANCSGFLKSAASLFGFVLPDRNADGLVDALEAQSDGPTAAWERVGRGQPGLDSAVQLAGRGRLILAAAKSVEYGQNNGHVAFLLPKLSGPPHNAPFIYGGAQATAARSRGDLTIRQVWSPAKHGVLRFYAHRSLPLGQYD